MVCYLFVVARFASGFVSLSWMDELYTVRLVRIGMQFRLDGAVRDLSTVMDMAGRSGALLAWLPHFSETNTGRVWNDEKLSSSSSYHSELERLKTLSHQGNLSEKSSTLFRCIFPRSQNNKKNLLDFHKHGENFQSRKIAARRSSSWNYFVSPGFYTGLAGLVLHYERWISYFTKNDGVDMLFTCCMLFSPHPRIFWKMYSRILIKQDERTYVDNMNYCLGKKTRGLGYTIEEALCRHFVS